MVLIDWIIIIVVLLSTLVSLARGFVKEAMSLASWIAAFLLARLLAPTFSSYFVQWFDSTTIQVGIAFVAVFVVVLILGALISFLFNSAVEQVGLKGSDRMLGSVFGLARGLLVVVLGYSLMQVFSMQQMWPDSLLLPYVEPIAAWTADHLQQVSATLIELSN